MLPRFPAITLKQGSTRAVASFPCPVLLPPSVSPENTPLANHTHKDLHPKLCAQGTCPRT